MNISFIYTDNLIIQLQTAFLLGLKKTKKKELHVCCFNKRKCDEIVDYMVDVSNEYI